MYYVVKNMNYYIEGKSQGHRRIGRRWTTCLKNILDRTDIETIEQLCGAAEYCQLPGDYQGS